MHHKKKLLVIFTALALTNGFSFAESPAVVSPRSAGGGGSDCPAVWSSIATELSASYLNSTTGQCTDLARQAIRAAFHDCGAWNTSMGETGGCDGSLFLSGELSRSENNGMQDVETFLTNLRQTFSDVTMADLIQFSASVAILSCPLGPQIQTYVGRSDSYTPAPENLLPLPNQEATFLSDLFTNKGFDAAELAALLGAHTTSKQFFVDASLAGEPQDTTPGVWDVDYYSDTLNPPEGVFVFQSDTALSQDAVVGPEFQAFVGDQAGWNSKFSDAMTKLSLLGVPGGSGNLIDCTDSLPAAAQNVTTRSVGRRRR